MNATLPRQTKARWLLRTYVGRILIALVLIVIIQVTSFWLLIVMPYQQELRVIEKIEAFGGQVQYYHGAPQWWPQLLRDRTPFLNQLQEIHLQVRDKPIPSDLLLEIGSLRRLQYLSFDCLTEFTDSDLEYLKGLRRLHQLAIGHTQLTDAGLERLKEMTSLHELGIERTVVTDVGLEHLKPLKNLERIWLRGTQTTDRGMSMLQKSLPNCKIEATESRSW